MNDSESYKQFLDDNQEFLNDYKYFDNTEVLVFKDDEYYEQYDYYQCLSEVKVGQILTLGTSDENTLIVEVRSIGAHPGEFNFWVINGHWHGTLKNSTVFVHATQREYSGYKITNFHASEKPNQAHLEDNYNGMLAGDYTEIIRSRLIDK